MSEPAGDYVIAPIATRLRTAAGERGWPAAVAALGGWGARLLTGLPATVLPLPRRSFHFEGHSYHYLVHRYKHSWLGERAVEVPIARGLINESTGGPVLEVGHVLGHYGPTTHEVVDKFERAPGVRNVDVLDLSAEQPYEVIVSISTLEHVGWDDQPRDPERAVAAVHHLRSLLAPGGRLLATIPLGYNPVLVEAVFEGRAGFDRVIAIARVGAGLRWSVVPLEDVRELPYDRLLYRAPAVLVCTATG